MSYKIAIATSDGKFVNQHFGRANQFLIVELKGDGSYEVLEPQKPMVFGFRKYMAFPSTSKEHSFMQSFWRKYH